MTHEPDLRVSLDTAVPARLPAGRATALFCAGSCSRGGRAVESLELVLDGVAHRPDAQRMPRSDPGARSGFWGTVPVPAQRRPGSLELELRARLAGGRVASASLATIEVVEPPPAPDGAVAALEAARREGGRDPIVVCMATFDPEPDLFRAQVSSLRSQSDGDWVCLVSDDRSRPERFALVEAELGADPRFVLTRAPERLGFYRNFERLLGMVPPAAELVALCDQDDRWHPDKLAVLREAIGDAELAYSDARLVDPGGAVMAESLLAGRPDGGDMASAMLANTVAGAASLLRRRVLDLALPFPESPGWQFHDHWLAEVCAASGEVRRVERPLYDYVQHPGAVLGGQIGLRRANAAAPGGGAAGPAPSRRRRLREGLARRRARYFYGCVPVQLRATVLLARGAGAPGARRRALRRLARAQSSPVAAAWLLARRLRSLAARGREPGPEGILLSGMAWRRLAPLCAAVSRRPGRGACDTGMPAFDPASLEPRGRQHSTTP